MAIKINFQPIFEDNKRYLETISKNKLNNQQALEMLLRQRQIYDEQYYALDNPSITDAQYDEFVKIVELVLPKTEDTYDLFGGSTQLSGYSKVGANPLSIFKKIEHLKPMLSLSNALSQNDFIDFIEKTQRFLNKDDSYFPHFVCEPKIDGLGFSAIYKNGQLVSIATRGDGYIGEDVTQNVLTIKAFPEKLSGVGVPSLIEIRGEIFMNRLDFEELNKIQIQNKQKIFANPRNAAAGSLRQIDSSVTKTRKLKYLAYSVGQCSGDFTCNSQEDLMMKLKAFGFEINNYSVCKSIEDVFTYYNSVQQNRYNVAFDIDGIVCKINDVETQERLGFLARSPRWAIAFKFSSVKANTKLINVEFGVGRTGVITPVAVLEPVNIGGVIIKKATLHNFDEIKRLNLKIGSKVLLERAGDVIPKIIEVIETSQSCIDIIEPSTCPCCFQQLFKDDNGVLLRCKNKFECKDQIIGSIEHFCSKDAFDIVGFASSQITTFYNEGYIKNYANIFTLEQNFGDKIKKMDGFGEKSASNLFASINSRRVISLDRLIYSLGFYGVGEVMCKTLAKYFKNANAMLDNNFDKEQLLNIDGIGNKTLSDLLFILQSHQFKQALTQLLSVINVEDYKQVDQNLKYSGKKIVFTGSMQAMSRNEAKYKAEQLGFTVANTISRGVDFVVAGQDAGSKLQKAIELNIKILNEQQWLEIF